MLRRANSKRKLDQLVIAKGNFNGKTAQKQKNTLVSISEELLDLFNISEQQQQGDGTVVGGVGKHAAADEAVVFKKHGCYDETGTLKDSVIKLLLDRKNTMPYEDGVDNGYQVVKHNTTFSDLF
jgi:hypothetical protein